MLRNEKEKCNSYISLFQHSYEQPDFKSLSVPNQRQSEHSYLYHQ